MNKDAYDKELNIIRTLAVKNGYKINTVENIIKRMKAKTTNERRNKYRKEQKQLICVPHNSILNKATRKTFTKDKFKIGYKTRNNAFDLINNLSKFKIPQQNIYDKSGIYKLKCTDCENYYIGQTGRSFKCRFKEHIQALKSNNMTSMKSSFAEHLLENNQSYTNMENNMKILHIGQKSEKLNSTEDFEIYIHSKLDPTNLLNIMQIRNINPVYDKISQIRSKNQHIHHQL